MRLREGAARERHAGNSGGEAEIIFNAGAGAGLTAEGAQIEHGDAQTFGCRIDGGGEAGGTGADHGDVIERAAIGLPEHAERAGKFAFTGVFQHRAVGAEYEWKFVRRRLVALHQLRGFVVVRGVHRMKRIAVTPEEIQQLHHARRSLRPHDRRPATGVVDQEYAAQNERPHDALAKFRFRDKHIAQLFGWN